VVECLPSICEAVGSITTALPMRCISETSAIWSIVTWHSVALEEHHLRARLTLLQKKHSDVHSTKVWAQGLVLEPHPCSFCFSYFSDKMGILWTFYPGWPQTTIPWSLPSEYLGLTGLSPCTWHFILLNGCSVNYFTSPVSGYTF
jgi:hypothetical protein